jgi:hypothetical protein
MNTLIENIQITKAEYKGDYCIRFEFSDGKTIEIDFYPFLNKQGQNPMVSQYLDKNRFRNFDILNNRDISWDDFEMCFSLETIYTGAF